MKKNILLIILAITSWNVSLLAEEKNKIALKVGEASFNMVEIPAGTFLMGTSDAAEESRYWTNKTKWSSYDKKWFKQETPQHEVKIKESFYISESEITQKLYNAVMGTNPSCIKDMDKPVECLTWHQAVEFCKELSKLINRNFRLPTEAEWEYACRAGTKTRYYWGDVFDNDNCWYFGNAGNRVVDNGYSVSLQEYEKLNFQSHIPKKKKPNAWGLYDTSGNVYEWCYDWYDENYYNNSPAIDPKGPTNGINKVVRGGSFPDYTIVMRSTLRVGVDPGLRNYGLGFRIVMSDD